MFGKLKQAAMKKLMDRQLKDVPEDQRQMIEGLMEKDPELMTQIAKEMQAEMKANGDNQMAAAMKVLPKHQARLQAAMGPEMMQKMAQMQAGNAGKFDQGGRPF